MSNDSNKEYLTVNNFSTLIGDMRVDILSMCNLLDMMNKNSTTTDEEIQNIKKDMCNLMNENNKLKERITKIKKED